MKKRIFLIHFLILISSLLFAATSASEKAFVKGSLAEKIKIIQNIKDNSIFPVIKKSLDFSIEHAASLSADAEFISLTTVTVQALPSEPEKIRQLTVSSQKLISERLMAIFKIFKNKDLRKSIIEKLNLYSNDDKSLLVDFLNDYLSAAYKAGESSENVMEGAIVTLGQEGNENSLSIIYNIWSSNIWPEYKKSTDEALLLLSKDSFADVIKIFSISNIVNSAHFFNLLHNSEKISENSLCSIAENVLLIAINNAEKMKASDEESKKAFTALQLETQEVLTKYKWSHASGVINSNVILAKKAYEDGSMTEEDFIKIIKTSVQIPSSSLAQTLTDMLSECNGKVEVGSADGKMPAKSVVLALISALGVLGDKTAFDTLLTVTYLTYPLEVIDAAKESLAKLNW
ncbi:MAG: hypothetical protein IJ257_06815 [Treponema sp.]|nr:hypothetical protein [Treponema sp.]